MKKALIVIPIVILLQGCVARYFNKIVYEDLYSYDKVYEASLLAMNFQGYTILNNSKTDGVIYGKKLSEVYAATSLGMFGIIPGLYSVLDTSSRSIVVGKNGNVVFVTINDTTSTSLTDQTESFISVINEFLNNKEKAFENLEKAGQIESEKPGRGITSGWN